MVECKLCNKRFELITNSHLTKIHNITTKEYLLKYGELYDSDYHDKFKASFERKERSVCVNPGCANIVKSLQSLYCSKKCAAINRRAKERGNIYILPKCQREECSNQVKEYSRKFCSHKCNIYHTKRVQKKGFCELESCGKVLPFNSRRFCSRQCYEIFRTNVKNELSKIPKAKCFKPDCDNSVTNSWNKYCSYTCSMSHRMSKDGRNEQAGQDNPLYTDGWYSIGKYQKRLTRERDRYQCRWCNKEVKGKQAHVHHVIPERLFDDPIKAHNLTNLVTLCDSCHLKFEWTTIHEMYIRALKLDELFKDDLNHISFESFKQDMLKSRV